MSARVPEAAIRPWAAASVHSSWPVARAIHVAASVSTTFGGVPRVCRGPSTTWTAPNGGVLLAGGASQVVPVRVEMLNPNRDQDGCKGQQLVLKTDAS